MQVDDLNCWGRRFDDQRYRGRVGDGTLIRCWGGRETCQLHRKEGLLPQQEQGM